MALKRGWPQNLEQFRRWKHLGNGVIFGTHRKFKPLIQGATKKLVALAKSDKPSPKSMKDELSKLRSENDSLRQALKALTLDLIQKGRDFDEERTLRIHYETRSEEQSNVKSMTTGAQSAGGLKKNKTAR